MENDDTHVIVARNVNSALHDALWWLKVAGVKEGSRNGPVLVSPGPVITEYLKPIERVLFSQTRDANPFFHLMEALWMIAGRNDLAWVQQFNSRFSEFSDDGTTLHAAYGHRWRHWKGNDRWEDQLNQLVNLMKREPNTRRAVLAMWDPTRDLNVDHRDLPCNVTVFFDRRNDELNMSVMCRSNDALWGAMGANAVHFSVLQEYLAAWLAVPVGRYRQFSHNFHAYLELKGYPSCDPVEIGEEDYYSDGTVKPVPLVQKSIEEFDLDLHRFMSDPLGDTFYREPFFDHVVAPMYASWQDRKTKKNDGRDAAQAIQGDWGVACREWIDRRERKDV